MEVEIFMGKKLRVLVALTMALTMIMGSCAIAEVQGKYLVEGFDWGPAVTKLILNMGETQDPAALSAEAFGVTEHKQFMDFQNMTPAEGDFPRTVLDAYVSTEAGERADAPDNFVVLELGYDPNTGSPFFYDFLATGQNKWAAPYELNVTKDGAALEITAMERLIPQTEMFQEEAPIGYADVALSYSYYTPAADEKKNALIIWLHGAGEGGADKNIVLLGNKVAVLATPEIQDLFGGAYVLCPQAPTMWMDNGEKNPDTGAPVYVHDGNYTSIYTEGLMALIQQFVSEHEDIDPAKIIIGGCSNGGFMTVNMLLHNPDYFRAAYPICEAYQDSWITDEGIAAIAKVPTWFTYAENDTVVDPLLNAAPTVERLKAAGANVQLSVFPDVVDMTGLYKTPDGAPQQYMGHWSWLYTLNNQCVAQIDGADVAIWNWLADLVK